VKADFFPDFALFFLQWKQIFFRDLATVLAGSVNKYCTVSEKENFKNELFTRALKNKKILP